jgi:hypothetical protein
MRLLIGLLWIVVSINLGCNSQEDNSAATGNASTTAEDGQNHDEDGQNHDEDGHDHDEDGHDHDKDGHDHDKDGDHDNKEAASNEHPAITVANQVLAAIQAGDAAAIRPLLNATNQKKISDDEIGGLLKEAKEFIGDVSEVTEVRESSRKGQWMAKIRVVGDEVFVVALTLEEGQYRFEDLNSPSVADYEAQPIVAP